MEWLMAPNLAPPARSGAVREASPPTHAVLRIGLNFIFLPGARRAERQRHRSPLRRRWPSCGEGVSFKFLPGRAVERQRRHPTAAPAARAASGCPPSTKKLPEAGLIT